MNNTEIERKFLVCADFKTFATKSIHIMQGYLSSVPERTVRVRLKGEEGYITIKGMASDNGAIHFEWEKEILVDDVIELLKICEPGVIDKTRYLVPAGKHTFEVDVFHGDNEGLVLAEIELDNVNESFVKPAWLGLEVTGDVRYYNAMLIKNPYKNWKESK
jgi:Uncharacterized protein conserved in bacteria